MFRTCLHFLISFSLFLGHIPCNFAVAKTAFSYGLTQVAMTAGTGRFELSARGFAAQLAREFFIGSSPSIEAKATFTEALKAHVQHAALNLPKRMLVATTLEHQKPKDALKNRES